MPRKNEQEINIPALHDEFCQFMAKKGWRASRDFEMGGTRIAVPKLGFYTIVMACAHEFIGSKGLRGKISPRVFSTREPKGAENEKEKRPDATVVHFETPEIG